MSRAPLRRVLLVGFMGAGKTTVGRRVATSLGWRFLDFDDAVEAEAGMSVARIFEQHGEARFRALEAEVGRRLLAMDRVVLGSGGGWTAQDPARLREVPEGTASFWLSVPPEEAVRRAASEPGARPLLAGSDALGVASRLLAERARSYRDARWTVDTQGLSVEDVSARILTVLAQEYSETDAE